MLAVNFDAANAASLPISATKQNNVTDFAIEEMSDAPTITKYEASSCSIIKETIRRENFQRRLQKLSHSRKNIQQGRNMKQSLKHLSYITKQHFLQLIHVYLNC